MPSPTEALLTEIRDALNKLVLVTTNTDRITVVNLTVFVANKTLSIPDITVPDGMTLVIESRFTNGGIVSVSSTGSSDTKPLRPGESVGFNVIDTGNINISGTTPGDIVILYVEKR